MRELSYKLKNIKLLDYANNLIFIVFGITLLLLTLSNLIYLFILSIYLIFLFKKNKKIFWLCLVLILIILIIYLIYSYDDNFRYTSIRGKIIDVTKYEEYSKYIIRVNNHKVLLYDYDDYNLKVGLIVSIKGNIKDTYTLFTPNAFDYTKYLRNNRIFYALTIKDCTVIKNGFSIGNLRSILINYFDKYYSTESSSFLKALLVGYSNSLDEDFYTSLKDNGTLHLFAISGLHVSFFATILSKGLTRIKVKEKVSEVILIIFLIIYVFITNFSASILRASLMYSLNLISRKAKLYLSSIDICSLSFIILVIINPLIAYSNGFILSYLVSFTIIMVSPLVASLKQTTQIFLISIASSIASLPVIININYKINLLTPLINVLFIGLVTLIMLPLSIIVAFISPLDYLYTPLV
ncbi:MAG: ComEC/Rec2 family competence protein, partial [Bacilli bacterium]|nr:ComEC/Rec2 family competence protein [Bacilli bacterium]